ncbi:MAG TPA: serine/threonine-protein kinase [Candidatus Acidoferrum sp.]
MYCSSCGAQVSSTGRFCSTCGGALDLNLAPTIDSNDLSAEQETIAPPGPPATPRKPSSAPTPSRPPLMPSSDGASVKLTSSDPIGGGRFTPGQMIAERYRIVAIAGRGGMGEVYRAEDLKLGQVVAIKFLPESLSQDATTLARFHSEVRIARQVSHPNVCRVFDIGDADGMPFLSMEYVDGEDLASVVRRIGRLSPDKATEVARQICAGLAAAHERGVIHRDLKPANVMLDGAGKIRISDFGLAGIAASIQGADIRAGTPAYMAPEQLAGKEVTTKSDIYSLGLILYEILTGKRAFDASTLPELIKLREQGTITNPSTLVRDLDPLIERVILRCLELDPAKRPVSALQVAAALPGGDPLAAALAAGETPSPEMVAAAGATEGVHPALALGLLLAVLAGLIVFLFAHDRTQLINKVTLDIPTDVLIHKAGQVIRSLGYDAPPADTAFDFIADGTYLQYIQDHDKTPQRWNSLGDDRPAAMQFWFRQSPREMRPQRFFSSGGAGKVTTFDPPMVVTGMINLALDTRGRLIHFEAVSPQKDSPAGSQPVPDWGRLFSAAELDAAAFHPVDSEWTPLAWGDARAAWIGSVPGHPDISLRVEAASYRGKPIYFDLIYPWVTPDRSVPFSPTRQQKIAVFIVVTLFLGIVISSVFIVRYNLRHKRGDTRGALRLGTFIFVTFMTMWLFRAHHVASLNELDLILIAFAWGLLYTALVVVLYLALEPLVRRKAPETLIGWSRLLAGQFRDPLVGRDLLIGAVYGVVLVLYEICDNFVLPLLGKLPPVPGVVAGESLLGMRMAIGLLLFYILYFVFYSLAVFFVLSLLRLILRKDALAFVVLVLLGALSSWGGEYKVIDFVALGLIYVSFLFVLKRFGLLVLVVGLVVQNVLLVLPTTARLSQWYAAPALVGLIAVAAGAFYGFQTARAGKPLFSGGMFES